MCLVSDSWVFIWCSLCLHFSSLSGTSKLKFRVPTVIFLWNFCMFGMFVCVCFSDSTYLSLEFCMCLWEEELGVASRASLPPAPRRRSTPPVHQLASTDCTSEPTFNENCNEPASLLDCRLSEQQREQGILVRSCVCAILVQCRSDSRIQDYRGASTLHVSDAMSKVRNH